MCWEPVSNQVHADTLSGFLEELQHEIEILDAVVIDFDVATVFGSPHEVSQSAQEMVDLREDHSQVDESSDQCVQLRGRGRTSCQYLFDIAAPRNELVLGEGGN